MTPREKFLLGVAVLLLGISFGLWPGDGQSVMRLALCTFGLALAVLQVRSVIGQILLMMSAATAIVISTIIGTIGL